MRCVKSGPHLLKVSTKHFSLAYICLVVCRCYCTCTSRNEIEEGKQNKEIKTSCVLFIRKQFKLYNILTLVKILHSSFSYEFFTGKYLVTESNFSIKFLDLLFCILPCYLLNIPWFPSGSISWCCFFLFCCFANVPLFHKCSVVPLFHQFSTILSVFCVPQFCVPVFLVLQYFA